MGDSLCWEEASIGDARSSGLWEKDISAGARCSEIRPSENDDAVGMGRATGASDLGVDEESVDAGRMSAEVEENNLVVDAWRASTASGWMARARRSNVASSAEPQLLRRRGVAAAGRAKCCGGGVGGADDDGDGDDGSEQVFLARGRRACVQRLSEGGVGARSKDVQRVLDHQPQWATATGYYLALSLCFCSENHVARTLFRLP